MTILVIHHRQAKAVIFAKEADGMVVGVAQANACKAGADPRNTEDHSFIDHEHAVEWMKQWCDVSYGAEIDEDVKACEFVEREGDSVLEKVTVMPGGLRQ